MSVVEAKQLRLPPPELRVRVHGDADAAAFLRVGAQCADDLVAVLSRLKYTLSAFPRILDFGCGCGRTLRWLMPRAPAAQWIGTDIDREAIVWCRAELPGAHMLINGPLPPLGLADGAVDLIYAISVFTHLDEEFQHAWLWELNRVLRPGGILLCTTHGEGNLAFAPESVAQTVRTRGFYFMERSSPAPALPPWYHDSFHTPEYIRAEYVRYFNILDIIPKGMSSLQDVVVAQKRLHDPPLPRPRVPLRARLADAEARASYLEAELTRKNAHILALEAMIHQLEAGQLMRMLSMLKRLRP